MHYQQQSMCSASQLVRITPGKYPVVGGDSMNVQIKSDDTAVLVESIGDNKGVRCWHALLGDKLILIWEDQFSEVRNEVLDKQ